MLTFKPAAGSYVLYNDGIHEGVYLIVSYHRNEGIAHILNIDTNKSTMIIVDFSYRFHTEYNKNLTVIG